jgi:hypothetical protein
MASVLALYDYDYDEHAEHFLPVNCISQLEWMAMIK